jgi:hypothetical protein
VPVPSIRAILLVAVALWGTLATGTASAQFGSVRRIVDGTAYTLDHGEFAVGLATPIEYGVLEDLTLMTHPILDLLMTPNTSVRYKVLDGKVALAFNVSYIQTFLDPKQLDVPGTVAVYPILTIPFSSRVAFSAQAGYRVDVSPVAHGMMFGGGLIVLATPADLISLQAQDEYYRGRGLARPTVILSYSHAFFQLRLSAGIAVGRFPIQVGSSSADVKDLWVYPVADVWWQF